jgi:hypothetical protein
LLMSKGGLFLQAYSIQSYHDSSSVVRIGITGVLSS